jgi:hypothetical protein
MGHILNGWSINGLTFSEGSASPGGGSPTPVYPFNLCYLVVAGGGGGGATTRVYCGIAFGGGAGGGGGGYLEGTESFSAGTYCIIIGAGGSGTQPCSGLSYNEPAMNSPGGYSCLQGLLSGGNPMCAYGGGAGGNRTGTVSGSPAQPSACRINCCNGQDGGSGGGASYNAEAFPNTNGTAGSGGAGGPGSSGQGYPGGAACLTYTNSGGGGGAGGPGCARAISGPTVSCGAPGGPGRQWVPNATYYGGGGGGGTSNWSSTPTCQGSQGGTGGGGASGLVCQGNVCRAAQNGCINTGGGGGGVYTTYGAAPSESICPYMRCPAGSGGSGIVVVMYEGPQRATGGTVTTSGTCIFHTFTSSGNLCLLSNFV